jgi:hypothetical protein
MGLVLLTIASICYVEFQAYFNLLFLGDFRIVLLIPSLKFCKSYTAYNWQLSVSAIAMLLLYFLKCWSNNGYKLAVLLPV